MNKVEILTRGEAKFEDEFKFKKKRTSCEGGKIIKGAREVATACERKHFMKRSIQSKMERLFFKNGKLF
jgi:hypothetical protein